MSKEKIFIVESNQNIAQDIISKLEGLGYVVAGQSNRGELAIQRIGEILPDLALVDIHLNGQIGGIAVAKQVNSEFDIPVIFISTQSDTLTLQNSLPAQAYGLIIQPFETQDLKSNIVLALYKHKMTQQLRESEERYALAVRAANDGIWDWNLNTNEIYYSTRWKEMLGLNDSEIGTDPMEWFDLIRLDDQKQVQANLVSHLKGLTSHFECEYQIKHKNGTFLWVLSRGVAVKDAKGTVYRMAGSQSDITARKLAEERLAHDALYDALTELPNRVLFLDRLQNRLERTKRQPGDLFAILFIDLDRFKVVNDSLGHALGDQLLITVANRLKQCLRPEDTISRLGGDEFAILLDRVHDIVDTHRVADRIKSKLITTTVLGSVERSPTASIGIVIFNQNYTMPEELLRDADSAMYRAKALGGNQYQIFDNSMHTSAIQLIQLEGDLKHAVERKEWLVYYQPIYSLANGKPVGAEALIRWLHPRRGILMPKDFIHVAEEIGVIIQIGEHVLRTACAQANAWRTEKHLDFWVSVNLSSRQFLDANLVDKISEILTETGLPGNGLRLEITENVAIQNIEYTNKIINRLEEMGVQTSLDDFGTGYSSLSYLKNFPLKVLKIDQSFIRDIKQNEKNESLIIAILSMARSMGLEVVAEGVEKDEQLDFLRSQLCDNVQGFLLSHPISAVDLSKILNSSPL